MLSLARRAGYGLYGDAPEEQDVNKVVDSTIRRGTIIDAANLRARQRQERRRHTRSDAGRGCEAKVFRRKRRRDDKAFSDGGKRGGGGGGGANALRRGLCSNWPMLFLHLMCLQLIYDLLFTSTTSKTPSSTPTSSSTTTFTFPTTAFRSTPSTTSSTLFAAAQGVKVEFAHDFALKPSMGYLRKCYEVVIEEHGWNLERIVDVSQYHGDPPPTHVQVIKGQDRDFPHLNGLNLKGGGFSTTGPSDSGDGVEFEGAYHQGSGGEQLLPSHIQELMLEQLRQRGENSLSESSRRIWTNTTVLGEGRLELKREILASTVLDEALLREAKKANGEGSVNGDEPREQEQGDPPPSRRSTTIVLPSSASGTSSSASEEEKPPSGAAEPRKLIRDVYVPPKVPPALTFGEDHAAPQRTASSSEDARRSEVLYPTKPMDDVPWPYRQDIRRMLENGRPRATSASARRGKREQDRHADSEDSEDIISSQDPLRPRESFFDESPHSRGICCEDLNNCCDGTIPGSLPLATWNHIRAFHDTYHVRELLDSTPRMLERHYTFYNLMSKHPQGWGTIATPERLLQLESGQGMWFVDCIFGALTILLNALPAVEFEDGLVVAQQIYVASAQLLQTLGAQRLLANWTIPQGPVLRPPGFGPTGAAPWAVLLGLGNFIDVSSENGRSCFGTGLKIYLHETGEYERGGLFCSAGQWGVEVILHRYLMNSSCRTQEAKEADLFLVPDYRACHYHLTPRRGGQTGLTTRAHILPPLNLSSEADDPYAEERADPHSVIIVNHYDKTRNISNADELFTTLINKYLEPWFSRNSGADHVFIFSDQGFIVNFTHTFPSWREHIHNSIFLTTEAFTPGYGPSCYSPWKDWTIPGHLDEYRIMELRKWNLPSEERTLLFSFHGRTGNNHKYYQNVKVRIDIEKYFKGKANTSIGDFIPNYFEVIGKSHFCLIPEGTSSWTNHLFTSFFAGCIPIILSDRFILPFQNHLNWKRLSIRWPQDYVSEDLYNWVAEYVTNHFDELKRTKAMVDSHQCWFDWYNFDNLDSCSPYKAIFTDLASRRDGGKGYRFKFGWVGHEGDGQVGPPLPFDVSNVG
ncbi:unnamed protein product [Amoebophrya sp. A25]|nr:unnamed protein product [Amoebophrya sp. A25]|eukprot:GSA25T00003190001.1